MASTAPNVEPLFGRSAQMMLQTHMLAHEQRFPDPNGSLSWLVSALAISAKTVSARLRRARLEDVLGEVGGENIQGEHQQKLDVIANDVMYPPTTKSPVGKLQLMYEVNPIAMTIEQAGGGATTGEC